MKSIRKEGLIAAVEFTQLTLGAVALNRTANATSCDEGYLTLGGRQKKRSSSPAVRRRPSRRTRTKSSRPRKRSLRGNFSPLIRNSQFSAALFPPTLEHRPAGLRRHPAAEAMHAFSSSSGRLVGSLHWESIDLLKLELLTRTQHRIAWALSLYNAISLISLPLVST